MDPNDREQIPVPDDHCQSLLQYRYFEVQELLLRPWLYIHTSLRADIQGVTTYDFSTSDTMQEYYFNRSHERATYHQSLVFIRLQLEVKLLQTEITDGPWLKEQNMVTLALMLIAYRLHSCPLGPSPSPSVSGRNHNRCQFASGNTNWYLAICEVESLLRNQGSIQSPASIAYADLLKSLCEKLQ